MGRIAHVPVHTGDQPGGKQLCRAGPGGLILQRTKHDPAMSTNGRKDQKPPGML